MNPHLKQRMLSAAITADKLWQREVAKALTDGLAEIERMHALLAEVHQLQAPAVEKLQTLLPLLHRLEHPTAEMREAMEGETPCFLRRARAVDGSGYEVGYRSDGGPTVTHRFENTAEGNCEALDEYAQIQFEWRYGEMLRVAAEQPFTPTGEPT